MNARQTWSVLLMIMLEVTFFMLFIILLIYFFNGMRQTTDLHHLVSRNSYEQH